MINTNMGRVCVCVCVCVNINKKKKIDIHSNRIHAKEKRNVFIMRARRLNSIIFVFWSVAKRIVQHFIAG